MAIDARRSDRAATLLRPLPNEGSVVRLGHDSAHAAAPAESWQRMRGEVLARETVELVGGFPGSATHAGRFRRARLTISDTWLIVNDERPDGFAIPFDHIESLTVVPGSARSRYAIQIRHRDGHDHRSFFIRFPEAVWPFRGGTDALELASLLVDLGIPACQFDPAASRISLAMSQPELRQAALQTMVWSGDLEGPIGGWAGQTRAACEAWLTTTSFLWRQVESTGVNRVALDDIIAVTTGTWLEADPAPVVLIAVLDALGDRHELPFVFNASRSLDVNRRECAAMLGGLRMRDVPVTGQARPLQPWQSIGALLAAVDATQDEPAAAHGPRYVSPGEFEAHCLIEIARLNRDIVGYDAAGSPVNLEPVANISHAAAVAELERRYACGEIGQAAMQEQRRRFSALIEARGKLAAIAQQRIQGIRPATLLMHQRDAVMAALNEVIMPQLEERPAMRIVNDAPVERIDPRRHLRLVPTARAGS